MRLGFDRAASLLTPGLGWLVVGARTPMFAHSRPEAPWCQICGDCACNGATNAPSHPTENCPLHSPGHAHQ